MLMHIQVHWLFPKVKKKKKSSSLHYLWFLQVPLSMKFLMTQSCLGLQTEEAVRK